ncbi:hypothetical protein Goklo_010854, partial [Gossypium klotzschianum]|nr:hypothetical protein [Gossypium klotzschianum]
MNPNKHCLLQLYEAALKGCVVSLQSLNLRLGSTPSITRPFTWVPPRATFRLSKHCWPANFDVCLVHDEDGRIPLHLAVMRGRVEVLQELITAESNSMLEKLNGNTTIRWFRYLKQKKKDGRVKPNGFQRPGFGRALSRRFQGHKIGDILFKAEVELEVGQRDIDAGGHVNCNHFFPSCSQPAGGVWAQDYTDSVGAYNCKVDYGKCVARTSVLAYVYLDLYLLLTIYAMFSFTASLGVVLLAISGLPLKNKLCTWLMIIAMVLAISFVFTTFETALTLVTPDHIYYTSSNSLKTIKYI